MGELTPGLSSVSRAGRGLTDPRQSRSQPGGRGQTPRPGQGRADRARPALRHHCLAVRVERAPAGAPGVAEGSAPRRQGRTGTQSPGERPVHQNWRQEEPQAGGWGRSERAGLLQTSQIQHLLLRLRPGHPAQRADAGPRQTAPPSLRPGSPGEPTPASGSRAKTINN